MATTFLFAARIVPRAAVGALQHARQELLDFLVQRLTAAELTQTIIVFDAKHAPTGRDTECQYEFRGIRVLFARDHDEADDLLEQMIRRDITPESLLVVSSDRRIQRAAQRRRAQTIDSDTWLGQLEQQRPRKAQPAEPPAADASSARNVRTDRRADAAMARRIRDFAR